MPSRLDRDQIIHRSLDLIDSPALDAKDRPNGVLQPNAFTIDWLQNGIDLFHEKWPAAADVTTTAISFVAGTATYALPTTLIQDYKDGLVILDANGNLIRRMKRRGLSWYLGRNPGDTGCPAIYVLRGSMASRTALVYPKPDKAYSGTLYYYSLPTTLGPKTIPTFPGDWALVEYVRLRGSEWLDSAPPGTSLSYVNSVIADLARAGIGNEVEEDQIPLDSDYFGNKDVDPNSWMGSIIP